MFHSVRGRGSKKLVDTSFYHDFSVLKSVRSCQTLPWEIDDNYMATVFDLGNSPLIILNILFTVNFFNSRSCY